MIDENVHVHSKPFRHMGLSAALAVVVASTRTAISGCFEATVTPIIVRMNLIRSGQMTEVIIVF
ncbi:hypothetical protein ASD32_09220 [Rhizobium sp. Root483D2]|nr:hypothetical protein ASD32_09220 [Rhizobium sp. Root483D2]